jgi:hypothetical protein
MGSAMAGPYKYAHINDMVVQTEIQNRKFPLVKAIVETSPGVNQSSGVEKEQWPESITWQTWSKGNVTALPLMGLPFGLAACNNSCSVTFLEYVELFLTGFLMMILIQETTRYYNEYYADKGDDNLALQEITLEEIYFFLWF